MARHSATVVTEWVGEVAGTWFCLFGMVLNNLEFWWDLKRLCRSILVSVLGFREFHVTYLHCAANWSMDCRCKLRCFDDLLGKLPNGDPVFHILLVFCYVVI
jgi:hypothetical protein